MYQMYELWVSKLKTKPWEINGNVIYQEDITIALALLRMDERATAKRREREERKARMRQNMKRR